MPPRRHTARLVAVLVAVLVVVPVASWAASARPVQADPAKADPAKADAMGTKDMTADAKGDPADRAFMGAMADMMADMDRTPATGRTDEDFVRMMMPHHRAAVAMARTELAYGRDPELKAMAGDIIASQGKELDAMEAWLARNAKVGKGAE